MKCPNCSANIETKSGRCDWCMVAFHTCVDDTLKLNFNCDECTKPIVGSICPNCKKNTYDLTDTCIRANDGGSTVCPHCRVLYHYCADNKVKIGSPGPSLCPDCRGKVKK